MRIIIHSLILLAVLTGPVAHAGGEQSSTTTTVDDVLGMPKPEQPKGLATGERKMVLKLHPLPAIGGPTLGVFMLPVELETAANPIVSLYVIGSPLLLVNGAGGGFALSGGVRGYLSGTAPDGFWLGAQLGVSNLTAGAVSVTAVDLQPQLGYQWVFDSGFSVGLGVGLSVDQLMRQQFPLTFVLPLGVAW